MSIEDRKKSYRSKFVLGTQYYRQPTPLPGEWQEDLKKIKSMGMEYIQLRPQWRWHERQEGQYGWDDIDRLMDLANKNGLKVIFKFMLETAPDYIFKKYHGYRIGLKGETLWPVANGAFYVGGWIPCFDHPDVMSRALAFVREGVKRYKDHDTLAIWHAWNEPRARPIGECTCEHSRRNYLAWLREKFGIVENLNAFTGKCWGDFEDIDSPRSVADYTEMFLWRHWAASRVALRVKDVTQTIKEIDPSREVVAHVGMPSVFQDVLADTSDDYLTRQSVDFYGSSMEVRYEKPPLNKSMPFLIADWMRAISGDGYFWINELYPSKGRWEPENSPEKVARWYWASVACGAKGVVLWQYRKERLGFETNDAGLVETDGRDNPTSRKLAKVFRIIRDHEKCLRSARVPKARVAMVYDFDSDLVSRIESSGFEGDFPLRKAPFAYAYKTALHGAYHLFWMAGIPVDFISSHELERISEYKMVYLPALFVVNEKRAEILKEYVSHGGRLIAEGGTGQRDANSWLHTTRPGAGLGELFGLIEVERVVDDLEKRTLTLPTGDSVNSPYINGVFQVTTAKVLAEYRSGGAAITENAFGKGMAVMTGFSPGLAYLNEPNPAWIRWITELAKQSGQDQPISAFYETGIYVRELESEEGTICFLFNQSDRTQRWKSQGAGVELITGMKYAKGDNIELIAGQTGIVMSCVKESAVTRDRKDGRTCLTTNTMS
jgi:beta-galactosidase